MDKVKANETFLCTVVNTNRVKGGRALIKGAKPAQLDAVCEIILNILKGAIILPDAFLTKFRKHKTILRNLAKKCLKKLLRKKLLMKYFTIVRHLVAAALPICGLLGSAGVLEG
jgi:hypothetical protein